MIRNINTDFLKNTKLKLCALGTAGVILGMSLVGCAPINQTSKESSYTPPQSAEEIMETEEKATIYLEYPGAENLEERDIITFTEIDKKEIYGIASTAKEKRDLKLPPGNYYVTSNYVETAQMTVDDASQDWQVEANYNTNTFTITEISKEKAPTK